MYKKGIQAYFKLCIPFGNQITKVSTFVHNTFGHTIKPALYVIYCDITPFETVVIGKYDICIVL